MRTNLRWQDFIYLMYTHVYKIQETQGSGTWSCFCFVLLQKQYIGSRYWITIILAKFDYCGPWDVTSKEYLQNEVQMKDSDLRQR